MRSFSIKPLLVFQASANKIRRKKESQRKRAHKTPPQISMAVRSPCLPSMSLTVPHRTCVSIHVQPERSQHGRRTLGPTGKGRSEGTTRRYSRYLTTCLRRRLSAQVPRAVGRANERRACDCHDGCAAAVLIVLQTASPRLCGRRMEGRILGVGAD